MLVLIILGLSMRTPPNQDATVVELDVYADSLGDQLLDPGIEVAPQTFEPTADVQSLSMTNLPEVSEPFAIPAPSLTRRRAAPRAATWQRRTLDMRFRTSGGAKGRAPGKVRRRQVDRRCGPAALAWLSAISVPTARGAS